MGDDKNRSGALSLEKSSGRVGFDERGNAMWEWQLSTGVYSRDPGTHRLKKLDLGDLSLADTAIRRPDGANAAEGFNPYDSSARRDAGADLYNSSALRTADPPTPTRKPRTPADLRKLDEWVKMKKRIAAEQSDD